jgi:glycosyltransferase involved in cell wall biosynthesis
MPESKRIVLAVNEILGLVRTGGAGTANTFLSFALARLGHHVEILFTDPTISAELDPSWAGEYARRGISVRRLETVETVVPRSLTITRAVEQALLDDPPDVVVAGDWGGPSYAALRLRELGLEFANTAFVVYCHGTNGWVYDAHGRLRRSVGSFELEALERATVELADLVVSPSAYMLEWMRGRGWNVPASAVVPYFTRGIVEGTQFASRSRGERVRRVVFFGRLEERKGIGPFIAALGELARELLAGIEVVFLGKETSTWPAARVRDALPGHVRPAARFETALDQPEAIALLRRPGTLAVMPSLVDNSPNVVYECLEHGIPFLAGSAGGGPELVAPEDRANTFVEPTAAAIRDALARLLSASALTSARPSFDSDEIFSAWRTIVETCAPSARAALAAGDDFVLVHEDGDELDPECLDTLRRAQAASGADVVTCGVRTRRGRKGELRLFLGEPRELGVIANHYGSVGLYRRALLEKAEPTPDVGGDRDWVRLVKLSLSGARIVSVPRPLASTERQFGSAAADPPGSSAALAVVQAFERAMPPGLRVLPRLVAGLAARADQPSRPPRLTEQIAWIWAHEGAAGIVARLLRRRRLHARGLWPARFVQRFRAAGADRGGIGSPEGANERRAEQDNGRGESDPELARIARRPGALAQRLEGKGNEPEQRQLRLRQRKRDEQEQEVVHPDDR